MGPVELVDRVLDRAPARLAAAIDLRRPRLWDSWGGPLNGQRGRQELVRDLVRRCSFERIVETGTFRGISAQYLADVSGLRVFTCEINGRYYRFARERLKSRDVQSAQMESRAFLSMLAHDPLTAQGSTLFYLDAHWHDDLPLREELSIIAPQWRESVVLVDDFRVKDDPGYAYDDYGATGVLDESLLPVESLRGWGLAYPSLPSSEETGARRGCCVLIGPPLIERVAASAALSMDRTL